MLLFASGAGYSTVQVPTGRVTCSAVMVQCYLTESVGIT